MLFDDWDGDEWNRFYNLIFFACRNYLTSGLKEVTSSEKIKRKSAKLNFTEEFLEYFDNLKKNSSGQWLPLGDEYANFLSQNEMEKKDYSIKRFKKALTEVSNLFQTPFNQRRNRTRNNQHEFNLSTVEIVEPAEVFEF